MKLTTLFVMVCCLQVSANSNAQTITLSGKNLPLATVFSAIKKQTGFIVFCNKDLLENARPVTCSVANMPLTEFLDMALKEQPLSYLVEDKTIVMMRRNVPEEKPASPFLTLLISISGQLINADTKEPIGSASVSVKNTKHGTTSDASGNFTLGNVDEKATLVISSVGFTPFEIPVARLMAIPAGGNEAVGANLLHRNSNGSFMLELKALPSALEEVVVLAFGSVKKKDLTGSVSTVSANVISQQHVTTLSRALEGTAAGLQLSTSSGQPGSEANIRVRGLGSLSAGSEPLVVVDGVPAAFPLSSYNPADIESIVISKDAASNSLYGSRASNGVILVTTKKGNRGKTKINFDVRLGQNSQGVPDFDIIKDPAEYYEIAWKSIYNYVRYNNETPAAGLHLDDAAARQYASNNLFRANAATLQNPNYLGNYMLYKIPDGTTLIDPATGKVRSDAQLLYYDDWNDYFIKKSTSQQYNVSLSGGNDKTDYFMSVGYMSDPSYVMGSDFNRYNARLKVNTSITKWLKGGMNISYARRYSNIPNYSGGTVNTNVFAFKDYFAPIWALYAHNEDGSIKHNAAGEVMYDLGTGETWSPYGATRRASFTGYSPAVYFEKDLTEQTYDDFSGRAFLEARFLKDFSFKVDFSIDNIYTYNRTYGNNESGTAARDYQGMVSGYWAKSMTLNTVQILNWNKELGNHHIDVLAGHEYRWAKNDYMSGSKSLMFAPDNPDMTNAIRINSLTGNGSKYGLEGYLARANYDFDSKYYLTASIRTDGSSNFRYDKWGTFWSLGGAWRISQEKFMLPLGDWLTELKLRGSYGTLGNQNVGANRWTDIWAISNTGSIENPVLGIYQSSVGNTALTWESNNVWNIGADIRLWDRLSLTVDYFRRKTIDMLWAKPLPASTGQSTKLENVAALQNTGYEVELGYELIRSKDLHWSVNLMASHYENKLLSIPAGVGSASLNGNYEEGNYLRGEGKDYYNLYMYKYAGVDKNTGEGLLYKELRATDNLSLYPGKSVGDIVTTKGSDGTKFEMGTASPDLVGGFNTQLQYKNFDFSVLTSWQIGGQIISLTYQNLTLNRLLGVHKDMAKGWTPENPDSNIPMFMNGAVNYFNRPVGGAQGQYSDWAMFDASYFNIKNVMLGYRLPQDLARRNGIESLRVFFSVENLHLFSAKKGLDPRTSFDGGSTLSAFGFPQTRTITFGLNLGL
ncbi:MAG: SusC/RagA family TonB-linked outer membrane protein [Candidatus Pseudobacter hemicellulosilyticus]|uniref:SusC/RagA family TonB-linked outer membrane protein n=1 Tax=Candidatus Pseudobacter hemicellulosilyticus TaxID=3121375 RepID=A0AAJ5WYZ0_9BACT|nr:MAG: SusC/RagA family TonB-linked outer membrane protein [Pseudobacter sp.]